MSESTKRTSIQDLNSALSNNVGSLRTARDFTYNELAKRAGLSKGMVVQIEQGRTNPSIGSLCKLANAFGVTISRLIEEPTRLTTKKIALSDLPNLWTGPDGSAAKLLAGVDGANLVEFWDWVLLPGHQHDSAAHPNGTKEMVYVLKGSLCIEQGSISVTVNARETVLLSGDESHRYTNRTRGKTHFVLVVIEPSLA